MIFYRCFLQCLDDVYTFSCALALSFTGSVQWLFYPKQDTGPVHRTPLMLSVISENKLSLICHV